MKLSTKLLSIICLLNFSCQTEQEDKVIKSMMTTFTSHQSDTQKKSDKTVAIAKFNIDGTIDSFVQHMTYPYDLSELKPKKFWQSPIQKNVALIMDGLSLSHTEKNFLYGNDWPKVYAALIEKDGHPMYPKNNEYFEKFKSLVNYNSNKFPIDIETKANYDTEEVEKYGYSTDYFEKFIYEDGNVARYGKRYLPNEQSFRRKFAKEIAKMDTKTQDSIKNEMLKSPYIYIDFKYKNGQLTSMIDGKKQYKFFYNKGILIRSEFYESNTLYNKRFYYFNEDDSKSRTEIFNANNEAEYTINYDYEYFESDLK